MFSGIEYNHRSSVSGGFILDTMTFTSKYLIFRNKVNPSSPFTLCAYNSNTGALVNSKQTDCDHFLPYDSLTAVGAQIGSTDGMLAEGCPHPECEVIRIYDITSGEASVAFEDVKPQAMCPGPPGTLLVCDRKINKLRLLECKFRTNCNENKLQEIPLLFSVLINNVQDMCYSNHSQLLILAQSDKPLVTVFDITKGEVVRRIGVPIAFDQLDPHLCCGPFGTILMANGRRLLEFHDSQRVVHETNCGLGLSGIAASFADQNGECKLAIGYETPDNQVRVDNIRVSFVEKKLFVPTEPVELEMIDLCSSDTDSDESSDVIIL